MLIKFCLLKKASQILMNNIKLDGKKIDKKYTPTLHFISSFQSASYKKFKTQLPVLLSLVVLHHFHQQIYIFKAYFRKIVHACIMNKKRHILMQLFYKT